MAIATGQTVGQRLCSLLGIDPMRVGRIRIDLSPNRPAEMTIEMAGFVFDSDTELFEELTQEYELVLVPKASSNQEDS